MTTPILKEAKRLIVACKACAYSYNDDGAAKNEFGSAAKSFLRYWAMETSLSGYTIHWNKGGPAVSGEVMLTTDTFEIWITDRVDTNNHCVMYRSRFRINDGIHNDRWDSGRNMWASPEQFSRVTLEELSRLPSFAH